MPRLMPHNNIVALAVAPSVWLIYFVLTYFVTEVGCARGWSEARFVGVDVLQLLLWSIAVLGAVLISYAAWQAYRNLKAARDPETTQDEETRERRSFLAKAGFFLCGISLLGTLWGAINIVVFEVCQ